MPTVIKPKYSSTPAALPLVGDLVEAEIALNVADGRLFVRDAASNVVEVGLKPFGAMTISSADINGGTIDGTAIGASTPSTGAFSSVDINGGTIDGTVIGGTVQAAGNFSTVDINGGNIDATTIGGSTPAAGTFSTMTCASVNIDGGTIDSTPIGSSAPATGAFTTASTTGLATLASVDINGGNIDGTVIGSSAAAAGSFTTVAASGAVDFNAGGNIDGSWRYDGVSAEVFFNDNVKQNMGTGNDYWIDYNGSNLRFMAANAATSGNILFRDDDGGVSPTNGFVFNLETSVLSLSKPTGMLQINGTDLTTGFTFFRTLTQAAYDGLTPDSNTLYFING